jgi:sugar phosphate isomerase/epimerase
MNLGVINSAFEQTGHSTDTGLQHIKDIGFDTCDIFTDPTWEKPEEIELIKSTADCLNLPIKSVCCVAVGLVDINPVVRRFHVDRVNKYLDMVKHFNAENLLLVLGEYIWDKQVIPPDQQWEWGVEGLRTVGQHAAEQGVEIVMELEPFPMGLLNDVPKTIRFLDDVNHPAVRANCDISHMVLSHTGPDGVRELGKYLGHVHISDCDGKVHGDLPPGRGVIDFGPYLKAIKDTGFDGTISLELEYAPDPAKIVDWVKEAYNATDRLMIEAGMTRPKTTGSA